MTPISLKRLPVLTGLVLAAVACGFPGASEATDENDGVWTIFTSTDSFPSGDEASRWHYWFDAQARYFDPGSGVNQYLVRPAIGYEIGENLSAWLGYARFRSRNRSGIVSDENRYWQQLSWAAGRWNGGAVSMRARLEQRSLSTGDDLGAALRLMAKYVRPIGDDGRRYLALGIEPFIDLKDTDWGGDSGLAQNRSTLSVGWRLSDTLTVEAGYMNQFVWVDNGEDRMNHLGTLNFKLRL